MMYADLILAFVNTDDVFDRPLAQRNAMEDDKKKNNDSKEQDKRSNRCNKKMTNKILCEQLLGKMRRGDYLPASPS